MGPSTEAALLGILARKFDVRFSLAPSCVRSCLSIADRQVTVGFDLYLVGRHVNPMPANAGTCKRCQQVLMVLLDLADSAVPIRPTFGPSRPENHFGKLTRFSAARGCGDQVGLAIRFFRWRTFEQATDGWATDFLMRTTKFLLNHGCRQVLDNRKEDENLARGSSQPCDLEAGCLVPNRVA
jgi:hypothetical protein